MSPHWIGFKVHVGPLLSPQHYSGQAPKEGRWTCQHPQSTQWARSKFFHLSRGRLRGPSRTWRLSREMLHLAETLQVLWPIKKTLQGMRQLCQLWQPRSQRFLLSMHWKPFINWAGKVIVDNTIYNTLPTHEIIKNCTCVSNQPYIKSTEIKKKKKC